MAELRSVEEVQRLALAAVRATGVERVAVALAARGRVLAEDVVATAPSPPERNSAMDGYAVRADEAQAGARLRVGGEVAAGHAPARALAAGEACAITTGAPLPEGADAVVMVERTRRDGDAVVVEEAARRGQHVREAGEDIRAGDVVLRAGTALDAAALGVLATLRRTEIRVRRRAQVAIVVTGDELRAADEAFPAGSIADSNSLSLAALVEAAGAEAVLLERARDTLASVTATLREAARADVVLSSGGVSVGAHDHVKAALAALGATLQAWRVDMKPGKPLALATLDGTPFFGLPGNPVSSMVAFHLFVRPALRAAVGLAPFDVPSLRVRLAAALETRSERRQFLRARVVAGGHGLTATLMAKQGSHILTSMLGANALVVLPAGAHALAVGAEVEALLLSGIPEKA